MRVLSTADAAKELGVNGSRVRQLILAGRLKAQKLGKLTWLILPKDLDAVRHRKNGRPFQKEAGRAKA